MLLQACGKDNDTTPLNCYECMIKKELVVSTNSPIAEEHMEVFCQMTEQQAREKEKNGTYTTAMNLPSGKVATTVTTICTKNNRFQRPSERQ